MDTDPIFIVGVPRSGTTLVSNLLNASNEIYIGPETHFFYLKNYLNNFKNFKKNYLNESTNMYLKYFEIKDDEINYLNSNSSDFKSLFYNISNLRKSNSITWGEKTPIHFMFIRDIIKYYPNSYFINVIRDPRDTIISIKKQNKFLDYKERINQVKISFNLSKRYPDIKIYNIKYEDINKPKKDFKKLFDEFELNFSRNILRNLIHH